MLQGLQRLGLKKTLQFLPLPPLSQSDFKPPLSIKLQITHWNKLQMTFILNKYDLETSQKCNFPLPPPLNKPENETA